MVSKQLLLSHGTWFLAVSLMDRFMDRHIVMKYRLKLVALTSLLIAGRIIFHVASYYRSALLKCAGSLSFKTYILGTWPCVA